MEPRPFEIQIPQAKVDSILDRVRGFNWPAFKSPENDGNWRHGPPTRFMRHLCQHWTSEDYDFRERERRMNRHPQFKANIDDIDVHFVHVKGDKDDLPPLLLLHGWPYSFYSLSSLVESLRHRFHLIVPSMPGYHFSTAPKTPMGPKAISHVFHRLMTQSLGYHRYYVHGGDWGSMLADLLGLYHADSVLGVHFTQYSVRHYDAAARDGRHPADADANEVSFAKLESDCWSRGQGAYGQIHAWKANKLAYALADSPVGAAAWILEAFHAWADLSQSPSQAALLKSEGGPFDIDSLIDEVMLYLVTDSLPSSLWIYTGEVVEASNLLPKGKRVEVPCAILALPDPVFPMPPKSVLERSHNVVRYTRSDRGGHFAFYEVPQVLAQDICDAFTTP
ncbi:alpha/beta-hydrolase [Acaromyces ingoldii]|uniref:Alpha/beta-hydrolase n=1 Tax=Acaromyces ingoldii TaxID=215250 RepID=A0A316YFB7_9BASI|nr:alpha/beta-hydrolase [Acaromyces ingoldii]PWN87811.1 alpha/beta-hydrolase [Acaromyces ingoldii]